MAAWQVMAPERDVEITPKLTLRQQPSITDGMRADTDGRIWCSVGWGDPNERGVRAYSPASELIGKIHIPETEANLCFGQQRNRLYICGSTHECAGRYEAMTSCEASTATRAAASGGLPFQVARAALVAAGRRALRAHWANVARVDNLERFCIDATESGPQVAFL
jgi:SMP-30/Gluconolactonase/LRE-like region